MSFYQKHFHAANTAIDLLIYGPGIICTVMAIFAIVLFF